MKIYIIYSMYKILTCLQKKTNDKISRKVQKTQILGHFGPEFAQKNFFSKIGLCHILGIVILHHCAKNQKKQMTKFREKSKKPKF